MEFDLSIQGDLVSFESKSNLLKEKKAVVELKEIKETRSSLQNRAMHLFFTFIASELNNLGITFNLNSVFNEIVELRYTPVLVKETIWRPIQLTLFNIQSTKDINASQLNEISETIIKYFADRGIELHFPSQFNKYIEKLKNKQNETRI